MTLRLGLSITATGMQAVLVDDDDRMLAAASAPAAELRSGVRKLVAEILGSAPGRVVSVMVASTALNELLRSAGTLARVGALRIGTTTTALPPLSGWPRELADRVRGPLAIVKGGADVDGTELAPLDTDAISRFAAGCVGKVDAVTVSSVFAPIQPEHELEAARLVMAAIGPGVSLTLSHTVGGFGLLERENAAILNAGLSLAGRELIDTVRDALREAGITAELFLAQNDGTLLAAEAAAAVPIRVLDSRLATAARGAALLAQVSDAIVLDHVDSTPRSAVLAEGSPVLDYDRSSLAGVRVVQYLPLGFDEGGQSDPVERMRRHARVAPVVAVGTVPSSVDALVPPNAEFASALGAATAPVASAVWAFLSSDDDRETVIAATRQRAVDEAILAGADPSTTAVVSVHETPLSYMTGEPRRLFVRAAGRPFIATPDTTPNI